MKALTESTKSNLRNILAIARSNEDPYANLIQGEPQTKLSIAREYIANKRRQARWDLLTEDQKRAEINAIRG